MRLEIESDHWYTPSCIIEDIQKFFTAASGYPMFYDPTTCVEAVSSLPIKLQKNIVWNEDEDFLQADKLLHSNVFMNPPYAKEAGGVGSFIDHLVSLQPDIAIVLVNSRTATRWWQRMAAASSAICMVSPRIRFEKTSAKRDEVGVWIRKEGGSPRHDSCLHLLLGNDYMSEEEREVILKRFRQVFADYGVIVNVP